jgi:LysR family glycine cleavage system transcriptional activator
MLPDLDSIRCFIAAAKTLNFRAGARAVSLTPAAFGKRIQQLEQQLDTRLFERTTRHVALTKSGRAMWPEALRLVQVAEECVRAGRGESGPATVSVTIGTRYELGLSWLVPMLPVLAAALPHVEVNYYFGSGPDLETRVKRFDVHCAVTSRIFIDPIFNAMRLAREDYVFVASPEVLRANALDRAADAGNHTLIDVQPELPLFRYFRDAAKAPSPIRFGGLRVMGTTSAIRLLVLAGEGVAVLPQYLLGEDLEAGRLVRLFPEVVPLPE